MKNLLKLLDIKVIIRYLLVEFLLGIADKGAVAVEKAFTLPEKDVAEFCKKANVNSEAGKKEVLKAFRDFGLAAGTIIKVVTKHI